jgi:hypothetical protein
VTELGFHADWARPILFSEFSFKRSVVSGLKFLVPKVFFQKIYGFWAEISCSQSFLSKDLWFPSSAFRSIGPGSSVGISCSQSFYLKDLCSVVATLELQAHQQDPLPSMCFPFLRVRHEQASGGAPLLHALQPRRDHINMWHNLSNFDHMCVIVTKSMLLKSEVRNHHTFYQQNNRMALTFYGVLAPAKCSETG